MARELTRRIIDKEGNSYFVSIPPDVNVGSIEDVLLGMHQGIVKLQGFKLVSDSSYRLPDNVETDNKAFTFHKKMYVFDEFPGLSQQDFGDAIQEMIAKARAQSINRPEITTFEGKPIKKDARGVYIDWSVKCHACSKELHGRRPISFSNGLPTRAQMFQAYDKGVTQYRTGSKLRLCPDCSVKSLTPEEAGIILPKQEVATEPTELLSEAVEVKTQVGVRGKTDDDLRELLKLSDWKSDVPLEFFKGYVYGVLKARLK